MQPLIRMTKIVVKNLALLKTRILEVPSALEFPQGCIIFEEELVLNLKSHFEKANKLITN